MPTIGAEANALTGGCLCGAVRYRLAGTPVDAGWCHCRNCQLNSGSPAMAFAGVPTENYVVEQGSEAIGRYASSPGSERWFCRRCGTPLLVQDSVEPKRRDFNLATLDRPELVPPTYHIFHDSRIPWAEPSDDLPRYPRTRSGK